MCYVRQHNKSAKKKVFFALLCVILVIAAALIAVNRKLDPIVCDIAREQIKNNISRLVSNTVKEKTLGGEYINVSYSGGAVSSISADTAALNALEAELVSEISEKISNIEEYDVYVSFSNLFDDEIIFGNTNFKLKAGVQPIYSVSSDIKTELSDAGINQTHYSIILSINVNVNAVLLISTIEIEEEYKICIADTVIVGKVPEIYLYGE